MATLSLPWPPLFNQTAAHVALQMEMRAFDSGPVPTELALSRRRFRHTLHDPQS